MPTYKVKISYIFTGTITIEADDEIDVEDKIEESPMLSDTSKISYNIDVTGYNFNQYPTNKKILVINKIKD